MSAADDPVTAIRNLGPAMAAEFARAGLTNATAIREIGADAAYARLLSSGHKAHFIAYYALVLGLQGRPWNDATPDEKAALRTRFDALKARTTPADTALDRALAEIGVLPRR